MLDHLFNVHRIFPFGYKVPFGHEQSVWKIVVCRPQGNSQVCTLGSSDQEQWCFSISLAAVLTRLKPC